MALLPIAPLKLCIVISGLVKRHAMRAANVTKYCPNISLKENEHNSTFLSRGPRAQAMQGLFTPQSWPKNDKAIRVPKLLNLEVQGDCSVSCVREIGR